jgi:2-polyprenyl-3-methyl-5-hydroxy-6-metoxy-1,4-benzoquinol methylase
MDEQSAELLEKIRQQFDFGPYPRTPLEEPPISDPNRLYIYNLVTPYYLRNQKVINTDKKLILDAGCGSGYKALSLALANPGAKIVGIDLSEHSIELAKQRFKYHKIENAEFQQLSLYDLPSLGLEFDYINCDELLYLFPEPALGLKAMKSVLKPEGIIRANLHSAYQRQAYFRAQELFRTMGLMDNNPEDMEIEIAQETMKALKQGVELRAKTWQQAYDGKEGHEGILMNYLFQGDKGSTIPDLFAALRNSDLEFVSMVNWWQWKLLDLFQDPDNLPVFLAMSLPETSVEEKLRLVELLHPIHRLLDFWCGHSNQAQSFVPVTEWEISDWQGAKVHLHPQLKTQAVKEELLRCLSQLNPFEISRYLPIGDPFLIDSSVAACLLPMLESPQPIDSIAKRWLKLRPVNPVTLEGFTEEEAFETVTQAMTGLEVKGYVLVERGLHSS